MDEKSKGQKLMESLSYKKKNFFEISSEKEIKEMYDYSEGYKSFWTVPKPNVRQWLMRLKWRKQRVTSHTAWATS